MKVDAHYHNVVLPQAFFSSDLSVILTVHF